MAGGVPGAVACFVDLKGRRRAAGALRRALPELADGQHRRLVRASYASEALCEKNERRAANASDVELCRRLRFEGWENLHNTEGRPLFLLAPLGSLRLASRVLDLYHEGATSYVLMPPSPGEAAFEAELFRRLRPCSPKPARHALEGSHTAVWTLALPERDGRWSVHYLPPVPPGPNDTAALLNRRYLAVLEEMIRLRPDCWPWRRLG